MNKTKIISDYYNTNDSAKLYYEVHGDKGPIIVCSNGLACPINHWHNQVELFAKNHRVLVYDLRGHHKSSKGLIKKITMDLLARDISSIVKKEFGEKGKASFWGHSYGVPISLKVASLYPEVCNSLVLINGFYKNPFDEFINVKQGIEAIEALKIFSYSAPDLSRWLWSNIADSKFFAFISGITGGFNLERVPTEDIEIYTKAVASMNLQTFFNHFKALLRCDFTEEASNIKCPSLIIQGERDELIPKAQSIELSQIVQKGFYHEVKEGSHCTQLDVPIKLNSLIKEFLDKRVF